jgi:hypothetical protein
VACRGSARKRDFQREGIKVTAIPASPPEIAQVLDRLSRDVAQLVAIGTPQEIVARRTQADAIQACVHNAKLGLEAQQTAAEAWIRLKHRLGVLLIEGLATGRPTKNPSVERFPTLKELRLTGNQSSRAQRVGAIPMRKVETYFRTARAAGWEITLTGTNGLFHRANADVYELSRTRPAKDRYFTFDRIDRRDFYFQNKGVADPDTRRAFYYERAGSPSDKKRRTTNG